MSAKHAVNPSQLKMFMTPGEITQHFQPLDEDRETIRTAGEGWETRWETDTEVWTRKLRESHEEGLVSHVQEHGVIEHPVRVAYNEGRSGKPQVTGGHHRIATQLAVNPSALLPVLHSKTWNETYNEAMNYDRTGHGFEYT